MLSSTCRRVECPWTDDTQKMDALPDCVVACGHCPGVMQGSLTAALPASVDVTTRDWLLSGMTVQLLQVHTIPVTPAGSTAGPNTCKGSTTVSEQCIARGVLQPDALLDGVTREWSSKICLGKAVPLFDAKGVRLGVHSNAINDTNEVCTDTVTWPCVWKCLHCLASFRLLYVSSTVILFIHQAWCWADALRTTSSWRHTGLFACVQISFAVWQCSHDHVVGLCLLS